MIIVMPGLGVVIMIIMIIVMPGLFRMDFGAASVILLVVERDWLDAVGCHHPDTSEVRSVDQTVQPTFEL